MSNEVFANGNEIACKSGDGKVIAAFPDVCLSPPSPPAGPIPVPYPDTSFSKDMQNGSKTVKIDGKEVMLKDKSFYKTSPLGDEAATRSLGGGVVSHVITGKTYFVAWSMDVKFEGYNVDRHLDLTTWTVQWVIRFPQTDSEGSASDSSKEDKGNCPCCTRSGGQGEGNCPAGTYGESYGSKAGDPPMQVVTMDEWYTTSFNGNPLPEAMQQKYQELKQRVADRKANGCTCNAKIVPEPPCNVFRRPISGKQRKAIKSRADKQSDEIREKLEVPQ